MEREEKIKAYSVLTRSLLIVICAVRPSMMIYMLSIKISLNTFFNHFLFKKDTHRF